MRRPRAARQGFWGLAASWAGQAAMLQSTGAIAAVGCSTGGALNLPGGLPGSPLVTIALDSAKRKRSTVSAPPFGRGRTTRNRVSRVVPWRVVMDGHDQRIWVDEEFGALRLGHSAREECARKLLELMARGCGTRVTDFAETSAERQLAYGFIENQAVVAEELTLAAAKAALLRGGLGSHQDEPGGFSRDDTTHGRDGLSGTTRAV